MIRKQLKLFIAASALGWCAHSVAEEIVFFQDFDNAHNQNWQTITNPDGEGGITKQSTNPDYTNATETIRADAATSLERGGYTNNFAVTGRNWDIHNGVDNKYVSGYRDPGSYTNPNMSGNMLGHEDENYDHYEDNYYQVDGISLAGNLANIQLMFDFDSWIASDADGFGVAYSTDGGANFDILNPTVASDMQYRTLGYIGDSSLNRLLGEDQSTGAAIVGFDGWLNSSTMDTMAGTAMFDLSGLAGQTISLRFAFASDSSGTLAEGINIDNIKVTGVCTSGSGPDCDTPGNSVPEPATLTLALLGLSAAAMRRRRRI